MKIQSRPEDEQYGSGEYTISMDLEELEYIAAVLGITRLGPGKYKQAAFKLMNTLEDMLDCDFISEASDKVDMMVSVVEPDGSDTVKEQYHHSAICLEV